MGNINSTMTDLDRKIAEISNKASTDYAGIQTGVNSLTTQVGSLDSRITDVNNQVTNRFNNVYDKTQIDSRFNNFLSKADLGVTSNDENGLKFNKTFYFDNGMFSTGGGVYSSDTKPFDYYLNNQKAITFKNNVGIIPSTFVTAADKSSSINFP